MSIQIKTIQREEDMDMDEKHFEPPPAFSPDFMKPVPKPSPKIETPKNIVKQSPKQEPKKPTAGAGAVWVCATCTLENREPALACSVCGSTRNTGSDSEKAKPIQQPEPGMDEKDDDLQGFDDDEDIYTHALRESIRVVIDNNRHPVEVCTVFLETLNMIMTNMQNNPESRPARRLNVKKELFIKRLGCVQGSHNFLQLCGYRPDLTTSRENEAWEIDYDRDRLTTILSILTWGRNYLDKTCEDEQIARKLAEDIQREEENKRKKEKEAANKDEALAQRMAREERERIKKAAEEEKASLDLVAKLNQMFLDEQFAEDLKKNFEAQQKREEKKLEEDMRIALNMQKEEEAQFQKLLAEEKARREERLGPGYWTDPLPDYAKSRRVELFPDHYLYDTVYNRFKQCNYQLESIEYVQNPVVWERYIKAKKASGIPEVWRFHGTPYQNVNGICDSGLLVSKDLSGRGTTIWSAENPLTSVGYSNKGPAPDGTLYMFLCRVLSTQPGISTVQNSAHIFPEFLITYRPPNNGMPKPFRPGVKPVRRYKHKKY